MKLLLRAANGPQAEMISGRLRDAGISALAQGDPLVAYTQEAGGRDVYVDDDDLERARELVKSYEDIDEDELIQAQEEAAAADTRAMTPMGMDPRTGRPHEPIEVPSRKRSLWDRIFKREAK